MDWQPIKTIPHNKFVLMAGDSGYNNIPIRVHVAKYDTQRQDFRTHSGDSFTDDGSEPTHWKELTIPHGY